MKNRAIVLVIGVLFLLGASYDIGRCGVDPGVPDTIRVDFISGGFGAGTQLVAEVTIYNDDTLGAVVVPLTFYNKNNPDLVCDSVSFIGSRAADYFRYFKDYTVDWAGPGSHTVVVYVIPTFVGEIEEGELAHPIMPGEKRDLLAKIYFTTGPNWKSDVEVVLDT
ncbi:MAG: hypothetical protein MUO85_08185, partial [candidate division Zixibacteria bacterium]|nr:hypothetical protein [candidate division Zixibacteria bacterium]